MIKLNDYLSDAEVAVVRRAHNLLEKVGDRVNDDEVMTAIAALTILLPAMGSFGGDE